MNLFVAPYKMGSESAKLLAQALGVKRIDGTKIMPRNTTIINWGREDLTPRTRGGLRILNQNASVSVAKNKLNTFSCLNSNGVSIPDYTQSKTTVVEWLRNDGFAYGRRHVAGQQGSGIEIVTADSYHIPDCPLYTKAIHKAHEYRVHVAGGQVIDFSKKKRRAGSDSSGLIKNSSNGWVFCRDDVYLPDPVKEQALKAMQAVGLDFGALDVVYKERDDKAYVLEINTAPGIEGTTLQKYIEYFRRVV